MPAICSKLIMFKKESVNLHRVATTNGQEIGKRMRRKRTKRNLKISKSLYTHLYVLKQDYQCLTRQRNNIYTLSEPRNPLAA